MDPPCCAEGMGTHQGLTGAGRQGAIQGKPRAGENQGPSKTLDDAIQGFLSTKTSLKEFTFTNYRRQLEN